MGDIALVICSGKNVGRNRKKGFMNSFKFVLEWIFNKFKPVKVEEWFERLEITEEYGLYLLKLPYETEEFKKLSRNRINSFSGRIAQFCSQKGIISCILPEVLKDCFETGGVFKTLIEKQSVFRSVPVNIIKEVYGESDVILSRLDIALTHGSDNDELFRVINLLAGYFNYLTVLTDDKESLEDGLNNIYETTGLSVGVSGDYKSILKSSHLIIHLGKSDFDFKDCLSQDKVIINYSADDTNKCVADCILIDGILIYPPEKIVKNVKEEIFEFFSKNDIAMILINYRARLVDTLPCVLNEIGLTERLASEFNKGGYKIVGFLGNKGVISVKDINH